jgi:hypothetical protein
MKAHLHGAMEKENKPPRSYTDGKTFPGSYGGENTFPEAMEMRIHLQRALEDNTY